MNKAFVINLDTQQEQFEEVKKTFLRYGISCKRFPAIEHEKGTIGCALSHLEIIAKAKKENWPWVMVMEDDAVPREGMRDWLFISKYLMQHLDEWDLFLGGCMGATPKAFKKIPATIIDIVECHEAFALYFAIYNKSSYDRMLAWLNLPEKLEDRKDIDAFVQDCSFRLWVSSPFIAWQKPGYSAILKRDTSYDSFLEGCEHNLQCFKIKETLASRSL